METVALDPLVQRVTHTQSRIRRGLPSKVVVRPGASSSVLTLRGTFVQKAPIVGAAKND